MIIDLYPKKAQYLTGEPIKIIALLSPDNWEGENAQYKAVLTVTKAEQFQFVCENPLSDIEIAQRRISFYLPGIQTDFGGFGAELSIYRDTMRVQTFSTAFDVVSDSGRAVRYGFLSDFDTSDSDYNSDVENLCKYHINMVQFYDWSYKHDNFIAPIPVYEDMMGRRVDVRTVKNKIEACRSLGMKSLGYGAVYAASKSFHEQHPDWGLYTSDGSPLIFIDTFFIMNVSRECPWHAHIIEQYRLAVSEIGFDGIHMDTYGFPKTAVSKYGGTDVLLHLEDKYPLLIEDAKKALSDIRSDARLIFNNVGNWPVKTVADSPQDAIYIEVWAPYERYFHIKQIILDAKAAAAEPKPVVLAAYLEPFRKEPTEKAENAAFLLTAVIASNGAYHLLLGEENGVLTQGYYVDHSFLRDTQVRRMRNYYDFVVRYMNILYEDSLTDVSMTHIGWDNTEYQCVNKAWSAYGEPDRIWLNIRENSSMKVINLVNLCGCKDDYWNQGKDTPVPQTDIKIHVQLDGPVETVFLASPDDNMGEAAFLDYEIEKTDRGLTAKIMIPEIKLWSMVCIRLCK